MTLKHSTKELLDDYGSAHSSTDSDTGSSPLRDKLKRSGSLDSQEELLKPKGKELDPRETELAELIHVALARVAAMRKRFEAAVEAGQPPGAIAAAFTQESREWVGWLIGEGVRIYGEKAPAFEVLGLGSFARGEMSLFSDVDIVFLVAEEDAGAMAGLRQFLGDKLFGKLTDHHGGLTVDDVTGGFQSPQQLGANRGHGSDYAPVYSHGESDLSEQLGGELQKAPGIGPLKNLTGFLEHRWWKLNKIMTGGSSEVNIKKDLLAFINVAMNVLADAHQAKAKDTVGRLDEAKAWGGKLGSAMNAKPGWRSKRVGILADRLKAHYSTLLRWRQLLHVEHGKEQDDFKPSKAQMAELQLMYKDFKDFREALLKDLPDK